MRAAIYLRQSLDRSGEGLAVERQRQDCVKLCEERGWSFVEYVDNDTSATKGVRPSYRRMLEAVEAGAVDAVVCWDLDRLHRQPIELEEFMNLADAKRIALATITGDTDLSTDNGRLFARIKGAVARAEIERKKARQVRASLQRAEAGVPNWPLRPFGFTRDGAEHPVEGPLVRQAYADLIAGTSLWSIAADWNTRGIKTARGSEWSPARVSSFLRAARNAGLRTLNGEIVGRGNWAALVEKDVYLAAYGVFDRNVERRGHVPYGRRHLLSGVARCGICGDRIVTVRNTRGAPVYRCFQKVCVARLAEHADAHVTNVVSARLARPDALELVVDRKRPDVESLRAEVARCGRRLEEVQADYDNDRIAREQYLASTRRWRDARDAAELALADQARVAIFDGLDLGTMAVLEQFAGLDMRRRQTIIDAVASVELLRAGRGARKFNPETVRISWKSMT